MPLITHPVTLQTELPGGEPLEGIWSTSVYAFPPLAKDTLDHNVIAGKDPEITDGGLAVLVLEETGQPNLEPTDFRWQISFVSKDRNVRLGPYVFELTGPMTLDEIAESSGVPVTSSILAQAQAAAAQTTADRLAVEAIGATTDAMIAGRVADETSAARAALNARYAAASYIDADKFKTAANTDLAAIQAACAAATALTRGAVVRLTSRTWEVGAGLSMSGYSCGLEGVAAGHGSGGGGAPTGTVLKASTQAGAVLDMTGWLAPSSFRGKVPFGNMALEGSNTADATQANIGLRNSAAALGSVYFHDLVISRTGGPGVDLYQLYLSEMDRVVVVTPVGAKANDVPYMIFRGCNGNRLTGLGFRSMVASADVGVSGALVFTDDPGGGTCSTNKVISPWFEFLHTPTNGTLISNAAIANSIDHPYFVDCAKEAGATGTSWVRFLAPSTDQGGNSLTGRIPGAQAGVVDTGVQVSQSRNRIEGVKGYNGGNVTLDAGVGFTFVSLGGSISGTGVSSAFVDNSGEVTNTLLDFPRYPGTGRLPTVSTVTKTADTTRNNTAAAAADPDLVLPVVANAVYLIEACIFYTATATADLRLGLTCPALSTLLWSPDAPSTTVSNAASTAPHRGTLTASGSNASIGGIGAMLAARPVGKLITGATAGSLTFQWAQLAAEVSDAVVHAGSWLRLTRVG